MRGKVTARKSYYAEMWCAEKSARKCRVTHRTSGSNSSPPKPFRETLWKIKSSAQKCFVSEEIKCIILGI